MRSINRINGVILASLGVLLGVMLAVSPREALAVALTDFGDDVLTVGAKSFTLAEATGSQTFSINLLPGETPTADFTLQLVETNPLTGDLLRDLNGLLIISDTLVVSSVAVDPTISLSAQTFLFISDPNGVGLPNLCALPGTSCVPEQAGPIVVGNFGSLGQVSVRSDVPEPSTWLLLLLGLGVMGLAAWQRKRESDLQ
jgi:hypothetical protein